MKAIHFLLAVMLSGALAGALLTVAGTDPAAAKSRHHMSGDGSRASKPSDAGQKSGGAPDSGVTNSRTGNTRGSSNTNTSVSDKGGDKASGPTSVGPMKKGDNVPGKAGPHNVGTADSGKNQVGDRGDSAHHEHDAVLGKNGITDAAKSDNVVADGPGHKTKKPTDTTKKITTIFRPHLGKDHPHPSSSGKIERNAIGIVIPNDGNPKLGLDPKISAKVGGAPGLPAPSATKTIPNAVMPTAGHRGNNAVDPPKTGPIINGTSVSRPGSNLTSVGGPTKNVVGALSGSSFKPKHP